MRVDLHTHSLCSDGSDTPADLVAKAARARLDVIALTDHDTVEGWDAAVEAGRRHGVGVVLGVEFSTTDEDHGQHLLGYGMDPEHPAIDEILRRGSSSRQDRVTALFDRLDEMGLGVDRDAVHASAGAIPSRKHVAAAMVRAGHVGDDDEAFRRYLNEGGPAYVQRYRPSIEDAITAIKAAGGVSVIAHPRDSKRGAGVSIERFEALAAAGLDGIEVDHQAHSIAVRTELRAIADRLGLAATGSSDHHGDRKVDHELGCNLTAPEVAVELLGAAWSTA